MTDKGQMRRNILTAQWSIDEFNKRENYHKGNFGFIRKVMPGDNKEFIKYFQNYYYTIYQIKPHLRNTFYISSVNKFRIF